MRVFAHREHQHARAWRHFTQAANGVHTHHAGQMVVQQDDIGLQGGHQPQGLGGITRLAHHMQAGILPQQGDQATPEQGVIVHHQQGHGGGGSGLGHVNGS